MNGLNLTIQTITPPADLAHVNRAQEILDLPTYLHVAATALDELTMLYVSTTNPGSSQTDKIWLKTDDSGTPRGLYAYINGTWTPMTQELYVGATAPSSTYVAWLRTADDGADFMGLYIYTGGVWAPILIRSVHIGTSAPANTTVIWVKTNDTGTVKGVYAYVGSTWTLIADSEPDIVASDTEPTQVSHPVWLKTGDTGTIRGMYFHNGGAYEILAYPLAKEVITQAASPPSTVQQRYIWAKTGIPTGLFAWDGWQWQSIGAVFQTGTTGVETVPPGLWSKSYDFPLPFSVIPFCVANILSDSSTDPFRYCVSATLTNLTITWGSAVTRTISMSFGAWGQLVI